MKWFVRTRGEGERRLWWGSTRPSNIAWGFLLLSATMLNPLAGGLQAQDPPFVLPPAQELEKLRSAVIETNRGPLYFELFPDIAPWHVANFKYLADKGFYRGLRFHYFYPGYIAQAGAPTANPDSGPGYSLPAEFSSRPHRKGILGMARVKDGANPERRSHGSQFHLLLRDSPHMDSRYTVFGELVRGFEVLDRLGAQDRIEKVVVYVRESR